MQLNNAQQKAITAGDGPIAIIAGPGTGKTKTLTERIIFLLQRGVPAPAILALTFTNKAAAEMRDRLGSSAVHIATFHALCFALLTKKRGQAPQVIAEPARLKLIAQLPKPLQLKGLTVRELSLHISRAKNMADVPPGVPELVTAYNAKLRAQQLYDFDDILLDTRDLLQTDTTWRRSLQQTYQHILVDEFQDTNALQYQLLQLLRGNDNVFVIGDPLQSIYGFRGADGNIFAKFTQDFAHATTITLRVNYRSLPQIVRLAHALYPGELALTAHQTTPGQVQAVQVLNEYSEAVWVLGEVQKAIGGSDLQRAVSDDDHHAHRSLRDIAVLYRSRSAARALHKAFADSGVPYQIVGEGSPYQDPAVQTILQLLAKIADPARAVTVKDMTQQQVQATVASLKLGANPRPLAVAEQIISTFNLTPSAALQQLCGNLVRFATVAVAVKYFDELAAQDFYDPRVQAVTLLTIHAAKGLEFAHVILIAAEDGILPSARGDQAEERRLCYVATTRTKQRLDILHAKFRQSEKATVSPFIAAIPASVLPRTADPALATDARRAAKRKAKRAQTSLF